jgi:MFS transporter, FHS family, glucose/mannose:H+ symporter
MTPRPLDHPSRLVLYLAQALSGVSFVTLGPLLNSILGDLRIPLARGGFLPLAFYLGQVVSLVAFNVLMARIPVKWCLTGAAALQAIGLGAAGLAWGFWSFFLPFFLAGFAGGLLAAVPWMWISSHVKQGTAGALTLLMIAATSTMTLTPVVLGVLLDAGAGWRPILLGEAALTLAVTPVMVFVPLLDIKGRENLRLGHVRSVLAFNPHLLATMTVGAFMYVGAEVTLGVWLPKFGIDTFGASSASAGLAVTLYYVGQIAGRAATVPLTKRFRVSSMLSACTALMAAFAIGIALAPNEAVSLALTLGCGLASSAGFSFIGSHAARFPAWHASVVFSVFQFSAGIGGMVFPYLTGPVAASLGFRAAIGVAAAPALIVALLAFRLRAVAHETPRPATG